MQKKMILVVSPPASGKTYVSQKLCEALKHVVYLDKDTVIPLSRKIFEVAGMPFNRSSAFFEEWIRNEEYKVTMDLAFEAMKYEDLSMVNAPFTREIKSVAFLSNLSKRLKDELNASLVIIWVKTDPEICHQRMIERNSDRDTWKLQNWDEYVSGINFEIPEALEDPDSGCELLIFNNNSQEDFDRSMKTVLGRLLENE